MSFNSKNITSLLIVTLICIALVNCSTFNATKSTDKQRELLPTVTTIPSIGAKFSFTCYGANFEPGEEVKVVIMSYPGVENVLGSKAKGLKVKTDEFGSFKIKSRCPKAEGIYPVRVYDQQGNMLAASLIVVKK